MLTRKHFELIANAMAQTRPNLGDVARRDQWQEDLWQLADALAQTNERFDRDRFIEAAGTR